MRTAILAAALTCLLGRGARSEPAPVPAATAALAAAAPAVKKVMVIVLENADFAEAAGQPFMQKLAARGAILTNYSGVSHPSQANYIAMIAGDMLGVEGDDPVDLPGRQLGDLLDAKGLAWGVYAEAYPGGCFLGEKSGYYVRKHVPFLSFTSVQKDPAKCARIKSASALRADAAAGNLPAFSLYVPDVNDDGHDTNVAVADEWLSGFLGRKLDDARFMKDLLIVVTFDESENQTGNHILTILVGDGVAPGASSDAVYDHYSLLRTVESRLGVGGLGRQDSSAAVIDYIWGKNEPTR